MRALLHLPAIALLALVAATPAALAQGGTPIALQAPSVPPPAAADPDGRLFALQIGKSQIVHLARPARDVLVGNPAVADVVLRSADTAFVVAKSPGETNVVFFDEAGHQIDAVDVTVLFDTSAIGAALKEAMPNEAIGVSATSKSVILTGTVSSQQVLDNALAIAGQFTAGAQVVNLLQVRSENQVLLRVRVSEMSRTVIKELGVSSSAIFNVGNHHINAGISSTGLAVGAPGTAGGPVTTATTAPTNGFAASFGGASATFTAPAAFGGAAVAIPFGAATGLTALLEALDENGLSKTLAEPNLTAVSGETASFLVGGKVPICTINFTGSGGAVIQTETFNYQSFGIQLTFTPVVMSSGLVNIRIAAEISDLETAVADGAVAPTATQCGAPAFTSENVTTTVELPSGGSIALAGLLKNNESNAIQGYPGLKDVPVLGALFSSKSYQQDLDDLVISVTAVLVKPVNGRDLSYPTDGFGPASDFNFYFLNRLQSHYLPGNNVPPPPEVKSTLGLILE
jgi:pilus assembly protein CpaC